MKSGNKYYNTALGANALAMGKQHNVAIGANTVHSKISFEDMEKIIKVYNLVDEMYDDLISHIIGARGGGVETFYDEYKNICKKIGYTGEPNDEELLKHIVENEDLHSYWLL